MYKHFFKRFFDILLSFIAIVILLPIYIILSILVLVFMGWPIIYCQDRVGKNEKIFKFYKFRSMTNKKDENGNLLPEEKRLTKFGKFIRSTSIDELPELFLILFGKMSIIGPRPLPTYYLPYYKSNEHKRHNVRGGLVPADTLTGETTPTWDTQLEYDVYYAENISFKLDFKIFLKTIKVLFMRATHHYGDASRPHLSEERANMKKEQENE